MLVYKLLADICGKYLYFGMGNMYRGTFLYKKISGVLLEWNGKMVTLSIVEFLHSPWKVNQIVEQPVRPNLYKNFIFFNIRGLIIYY